MKNLVFVLVSVAIVQLANRTFAEAPVKPSPANVGQARPLVITEPNLDFSSRRDGGKSTSSVKDGQPHTGASKDFAGNTRDNGVGSSKYIPEPLVGAGAYDPTNVGEARPYVTREQNVPVSEFRDKGKSASSRKEANPTTGTSKDFSGKSDEFSIGSGKDLRGDVKRASAEPKAMDDEMKLSDLTSVEIEIDATASVERKDQANIYGTKKVGRHKLKIRHVKHGEPGQYTDVAVEDNTLLGWFIEGRVLKTVGDLKRALPSDTRILFFK